MRSTHISVAKHRQGHIFPIVINMNTLESSFVGILQPLPCQDDFIFFYDKSLMVTAASQGALSMMGVRLDVGHRGGSRSTPALLACKMPTVLQ